MHSYATTMSSPKDLLGSLHAERLRRRGEPTPAAPAAAAAAAADAPASETEAVPAAAAPPAAPETPPATLDISGLDLLKGLVLPECAPRPVASSGRGAALPAAPAPVPPPQPLVHQQPPPPPPPPLSSSPIQRPNIVHSLFGSAGAAAAGVGAAAAAALAERDDFDCPLCMKLLVQPLALMCGHTFCCGCIKRSLKVQQSCPLCRHPCFINVRDATPNFLISKLISSRYGDELAERIPEVEQDEAELDAQKLGIYFLPDLGIIFPGAPIHLRVDEPRYLALMQRCMENQVPFGVTSDARELRGVSVKISDVKRTAGDRLMVIGVTAARYQCMRPPVEEEGTSGLHYAAAAFVSDVPLHTERGTATVTAEQGVLSPTARRCLAGCASESQQAALLRSAMAAATVRMISELNPESFRSVIDRHGSPPSASATAERWSYYLADALALPRDVRLEAFETTSTVQRLLLCYAFLEGAEAAVVAAAAESGLALQPLPDLPPDQLDPCRRVRAAQVLRVFVDVAVPRDGGGGAGVIGVIVGKLQDSPLLSSLIVLVGVVLYIYWFGRAGMGRYYY